MENVMRLVFKMPILELTREYERRYKGSEHHILYQPQQILTIEVSIVVPHMIEINNELKQEIGREIAGALRRTSYRIGEIVSLSLLPKEEFTRDDPPPPDTSLYKG